MPMFVVTGSLVLGQPPAASAQSSAGDETLDEAFSMKLSAKSTRDLDKVVDACEKAMEEGLDEEGEEQAKQLAAAALIEHAEQLARPILEPNGRDRRWQVYRRQALSRLKKATEFQPKMGSAWLLITKLHGLPGGDPQAAAVAVEKAIELAGDDRRQLSVALLQRALLARKSGDEDTLLADLDQAIKIDPDNFDAYRTRGEYYLSKREPEKALEDLNLWLGADRTTLGSIAVVNRLIAMDDKFDAEMQQAALEILSKAIENDPKSPAPYLARAKVHAIQEDVDAALNDVDDALELAPEDEQLIRFRTRILIGSKRLDEANKTIDEFLEKNPDDFEMVQYKLSVLVDQGNYAGAIVQLRKLIRQAPDSIGYRRQLAALYNADNRPSQAVRVYSRLLDDVSSDRLEGAGDEQRLVLLSTRAGLLQGRGNARLSAGQHKEAIEDYDEGLDLSYQLRDLLEELDIDPEKAGENATLVGILNNCAWVLATSTDDELRDGSRAIELATEAAEMTDFKEAYILSTLASGYAETGNFDDALKWIDKAIDANAKEGKKLAEEDGGEEEATRNDEQTESLRKEKASYVAKKPWREKQNVEAEKEEAEKAKKDKAADDADDADDEAEANSDDEASDDSDDMQKNGESDAEESEKAADEADDDSSDKPDVEEESEQTEETPKAEEDTPESDEDGPDPGSSEPKPDPEPDAEPDSGTEPDTTPETEEPDKI
ncbi:tetratricopeptide repeat protein [Mariniblastus sp.]|nr:tetratricopeptide repeat protein [Mariniblastus sp.]